MKNPFKKSGIVETATKVVIGGAANVAIDAAVSGADFMSGVSETWVNVGKIVVGAVAGSMSKNKYIHAAADGIATVGASNLVKGLMDGTATTTTATAETASGLPWGTIGKSYRLGNKAYRRSRGTGAVPSTFMGK